MTKAKKPTMKKNWREKAFSEAHELYIDKGIKWKDWSLWLRFRMRLINFILDWLTWDAVKSGWRTPRLKFKIWWFYKRYPFLKKD